MLVDKNHQTIRSKCLAYKFSFTDIFKDINHGYKAALLKKSLCGCFQFIWIWLLIDFWKGTQGECLLLKYFCSISAGELNNIDNEDKVFAKQFSSEESEFWDSDNEYI